MGGGTTISELAAVSSDARLDEGVEVGPYSVIERNVRVGKNTRIGPHCYIRENTEIGENCVVESGAKIGIFPKGFPVGNDTGVVIGDNATIGENAMIERASKAGVKTRIGSNSWVLPNVHVGHNCSIGDYAFLTNGVKLAGYVIIGDCVNLAADVGVHQHVSIGRLAFVGARTSVGKDVVPYGWLADGRHPQVLGLNEIGITRARLPQENVRRIQGAYEVMRDGSTVDAIVQKLESLNTDEAREISDFLKSSKRGCYLVRSSRLINPTRFYKNQGDYHSNRGLR
ncbi:MAG: acyl-ACP--UDP-N-acetylglucosamine O-acyltransferase [Candidatus Woesearchaeota archaeon]